ncbi:MAG: hypothetical protein LBH07_02025 [Treponema sp.]|jgi:hypothetical protein|nr:hypothetical protein [Treponema sp.]
MNDLVDLVRRRIESRYRRILFVHQELAKLDSAPKAIPGESFEDFVFRQIDFSRYNKIDSEEFRMLFDDGLTDFGESFYREKFGMNREEIRKIISGTYKKTGSFFICNKTSPLLLSIIRTVHTSLEFAPILSAEDFADLEQFDNVLGLLNGMAIHHDDGMETVLFQTQTALWATFYPLGKAYTIALTRKKRL